MPTKHPDPTATKPAAPGPAKLQERKPWKKKTPVDIVFDQITKLKREIELMDQDQQHRCCPEEEAET